MSHIEAKIGDVSGGSQVAVGSYIVQIGRVEGGIVNILNEAPPPPRPRPQPVLLRPKPFVGLLDRQTETSNALAALQSQQTVECTGEAGSGKTSLLRHLAHQSQLATTFPAGVVYFHVNQQTSADLLKSIFDAFYICDFPIKPNDTEIRHYLQSLQALVLLDEVRATSSEIETLMNVAPNCTFIAVTEARSLFGETVELTLAGLPTEDAVILFKKELGRPLTAEEENGARQICESVACVPLLVLRAAHEARQQKRSLVEVVFEGKSAATEQRLAESEIKSTSEDEKKVLAVLATFAGVTVAAEHVTAIAGVANAQQTLDDLEARGLVQSHEHHYSLASDLTNEELGEAKHWFARSLSHFLLWTEENRRQPEAIAASAEAILLLMKKAADAKLWDEVRRLGHASEEALTVSGKWDMWARALKKMQAAAQAQGDTAESAWVLHQLGTRALCLGDRAAAEAALRDALGIRERLGDITGAAVTRHNLNLLLLPLPPEPDNNDNSNGGGGSEPSPLWLKMGVMSLVGLAILTGLLVWFVVNRKPPVIPLKIASFTITPTTIPANGEAQLCYEVEQAASVRIEPGIGERKPASKECLSVMPSETLTYTLTAVATDGTTTSQQLTLTVNAPAPPPQVQIANFAVERQDGPGGANEVRFRLCYEVRNAAHAEVDNDVGAVILNRPNCQRITPQQTTTYTLSATGTDGLTVTRQATADATKPPAPKPEILGLKAVPEQVIDDGTSKLCFELKGAANASIDPGARTVPVSSGEQCVNIKPLKTTTYTLKAFNAEGLETSGSQTITVLHSPKVLEFSVEPRTITRGASVSLCYRVENANGVSIDPNLPRARPGGGERTCVKQQPTATTTYTLTAFSDSGLKSQPRQDTVTVEEPKLKHVRILFFDVSSTVIKRGGSVTLCYGVADAEATSISPFRRDFPNLEKHCFDHAPKESTTYELKTTGEDKKEETRQLSVTVEKPPEPQVPPVKITRFEINPTAVHGTQICYGLENARSARIEPEIGDLQNLTRGCPRLPSLERQTYTLIATGADGSTDKKSLTFTPPEPPKPLPIRIISFKGPAEPIRPKAEAKLCYRTLGEGKAEILPQPGAVTPSFRNCVSVFPQETARYTMTVFGPQGQKSSRTVTVRVQRDVIIR